jgi:CRP/FNR family transcriptional regulator
MSAPPDQAAAALANSFLGRLPAATIRSATTGAAVVHISAGGRLYTPGFEPWVALVVDGVVRVFMESAEGRQATVRYAREGAVLGLAALLGGAIPLNVAAVTDATLLRFDTAHLTQTCRSDAQAAWAVATEMAGLVVEVVHEVAEADFASVQQRVVRHLLDLASDDPSPDGTLVARVTQQQLADAAGTVREVVARTLAELRRADLVATVPGGVRLVDPGGLHRATWSGSRG